MFFKKKLNSEGFNVTAKPNNCISTINNSVCNDNLVMGNFLLKMQKDGNLVIYKDNNPIWETKTTRPMEDGPFQLKMQGDGNLVIYDKNDNSIWASGTAGKGTGPYRLMLLGIGALIIQDTNETIIWNSMLTPGTTPLSMRVESNKPTSTFPVRTAFIIRNTKKDNVCLFDDNWYSIENRATKKAKCNSFDVTQQWIYDPATQKIKNPYNGLCLDDGGVKSGVADGRRNLISAKCTADNNNQKFIYDPVFKRIINPAKNLCIDDGGGDLNNSITPYLNHCAVGNENEAYEPIVISI